MTPSTPPKKQWSWRSQAFRGLVYQALALGLITLALWYLAHNTLINMRARGIQSGFDFLLQTAGFDIGESLFAFDSSEKYWRAFLVGLTNTLRVALLGIIFTTLLGTLVGVGRFSRNALVRGLCSAYVEVFRNIPILLQLLMWYLLFTELLPDAAEAWQAGSVYLSKGGINFPIPIWAAGHGWALIGLLAGAVGAWVYRRWAFAQFEATGQLRSMVWLPLGLLLLGAVGQLQFEVVAHRLEHEYGVKARIMASNFNLARWVTSEDPQELKKFMDANAHRVALDAVDAPTLLVDHSATLRAVEQQWPKIKFHALREHAGLVFQAKM